MIVFSKEVNKLLTILNSYSRVTKSKVINIYNVIGTVD